MFVLDFCVSFSRALHTINDFHFLLVAAAAAAAAAAITIFDCMILVLMECFFVDIVCSVCQSVCCRLVCVATGF